MERKPRPTVDLHASCACGAVAVTARGMVRSMFQCACEDCQRASGGGHASIAIFNASDVTITGETRSFTTTANSGATMTRRFCPNCGTPIAGQSGRAADKLNLPVGLFGADTGWFTPNQLIFARSHRDWDMIAAELPQHGTYRGEE